MFPDAVFCVCFGAYQVSLVNLGFAFDETHAQFQPGLYAAQANHKETILFLPYPKFAHKSNDIRSVPSVDIARNQDARLS